VVSSSEKTTLVLIHGVSSRQSEERFSTKKDIFSPVLMKDSDVGVSCERRL
jgi:hypothetical protein